MINSYFFNAVESGGVYDRTYDAEDFAKYLDKLVTNGVFPTPTTNLQVRADSGLSVIVGAGQGWIDGHKIDNTADYPLTLTAADAVYPRIDAIVFYADYTNREMGIGIVKGTPASSPVAPALTRTSAKYEMALAYILVAKSASTISADNITDTRGDEDLCGYVHGLVRPLTNIHQLHYTHTTTQVSEDTFDVTSMIEDYVPSTDMLEIYVSGLRLPTAEYTESAGIVVLDTPITHTGTEIEFVVIQSTTI